MASAHAAIVADPSVERRARDDEQYLDGVLEETMRLWPTTPLLARETTREATLAGEQIEPETQVMILNVFNHRDPEQVEDADRLKPERWADAKRDYRFNHLSNGTQDCPGGPLVLLLGKAVLARMLERFELKLEQPSLQPGEPLPHMLDFFSIRFSARER